MNIFNLFIDTYIIPVYLLFFSIIGKFFYGNIINKFKNNFQKSYLEIIFGFIITITFYAIFKTAGKSVLLLFLFVFFGQYLVFKIKPDIYFFKKITKKDFLNILLLFVFFLLFFAIQLFMHEYFNTEYVKLGWGDYGYYSNLAETFNITGIERADCWNIFFNSKNIFYSSNPSPYHYFEIWTQAFLLNFTINKGIFVFIYILTPFLSMLVSGSFLSLAYSYLKKISNTKKILFIITSFLLPFFVGKLPYFLGGVQDNVLYYPRNIMFYILFILFLIFYKKELKKESIFFIGLLGFVNILYLPTISILLVLLSGFQFIILKQKKIAIISFFVGFVISFLSFIFYFIIFKTEGTYSFNIDSIFPIKEYILKGLRYYFRLQLFRIWFFYLPLTIFAIYYIFIKIKEKSYTFIKNEVIFIVFLLELISLFFASFIPHLESGTFNSIILNPLASILQLLAIIYLINNFKPVINKIILGFLFFQVIYSILLVTFNIEKGPYTGGAKFGKEFLTELSKQNFGNKIGVFVSNPNFKKSVFGCKQNLSWNTSVFDVIDNGYTQVSLSAIIQKDSIPFETIKPQAMNTPMFKYGSNILKNKTSFNRDTIELNFLKDFNIEYLIFNNGAKIKKYLKPYIIYRIEDRYSGIKIVIVKMN